MAFHSVEQVGAWAEVNGGAEGLRRALADGRFGAERRTLACAEEWLRIQEGVKAAGHADAERDLRRREVAATEQSAKSARSSARWAMIAGVVAAASLLISLIALVR